jgi:hypothetical protein
LITTQERDTLQLDTKLHIKLELSGGIPMAKPNYSFEKRKKELDRQKKKDEKKARKGEQNADGTEQEEGSEDTEAAPETV